MPTEIRGVVAVSMVKNPRLAASPMDFMGHSPSRERALAWGIDSNISSQLLELEVSSRDGFGAWQVASVTPRCLFKCHYASRQRVDGTL
ncbi:hypothetical protein [Schlesneria sp. DSM 10557]|uniref:hypothetical protein n=1 Tax=Schlesneria sp. DSM 10557 TaxID=3044399 RepID=UPI0035A12FBC